MPFQLLKTMKGNSGTSGVAPEISEYEERFRADQSRSPGETAGDYKKINELYYDLVTDFFEYGWSRSFHFAPRVPGESFRASLARHERNLAQALELKPGMVAADFGCGIGGPLLEIARFSGAKIVGININGYQLERARQLAEEADLAHLAEFLQCDFLHVETPDESFDAVYSIEATCCAPDKLSIYGEIFRVLKPGARFAAYEYCMTDRFDPQSPVQLKLKGEIELGGGLLNIDDPQTVVDALRSVGFEVLETRDLALQTGPSVPWYEPLVGSGISFASFRSSNVGRWVTLNSVRVLETLRIAPKGSVRVLETLELCAAALAEAGRLGIFTPMYFIHARKPE